MPNRYEALSTVGILSVPSDEAALSEDSSVLLIGSLLSVTPPDSVDEQTPAKLRVAMSVLPTDSSPNSVWDVDKSSLNSSSSLSSFELVRGVDVCGIRNSEEGLDDDHEVERESCTQCWLRCCELLNTLMLTVIILTLVLVIALILYQIIISP